MIRRGRMPWRSAMLGLVTAGLLAACALPGRLAVNEPAPKWIWRSEQARDYEVGYFRRQFDVAADAKVRRATLAMVADDRVLVHLNGQRVMDQEGWRKPTAVDVTSLIQPGANVLGAGVTNWTGDAALALKLRIETDDGRSIVIVTDSTWQASSDDAGGWLGPRFDKPGWAPAHALARLGDEPWGKVDLNGASPVPWQGAVNEATAARSLHVPPGFRADLLYSVPRAQQGSWVATAVDGRGRLIVSDQAGGLYRVTPPPDQALAPTTVEPIPLDVGQAQGLLWAYDSLYVVVNGRAAQGPGLYRLRDSDGDDQLDELRLLKKFNPRSPGTEHGPHGIVLGPDGLLYITAGNMTQPPDGLSQPARHQLWAEDQLLPRAPASTGHATGVMAPGGWIARTDRDGRTWELWCAGFRNAYDLAFNPDGELFTYDSDLERDEGAPWYRPTRVNHCVSAAEFGWRYGTGKWPAYYPDSLGSVVDVGRGSPTGVTFGTGARFPARWQRALFINDWVFGRMLAVHLSPAGASYRATFEPFITGQPLALTDVVIGADGAMYLITGGRQSQSGLYRVIYVGDESTAPAAPIDDPAAAAARALRHRLEAYHTVSDPRAIDLAWDHLNSRDRFIRYAARIAIEHQDVSLWRDRALNETRVTASINALVALCRCGDASMQPAVLAALDRLPLATLTEEQMLEALRAYALAFIRMSPPGGLAGESRSKLLAHFEPLYPSRSGPINREMCQVLTYLGSDQVVAKSMALLAAAQSQEAQLHYAFVLRNATAGWTPALRQAYFRWLNTAEYGARAGRFVGGVHIEAFARRARADALSHLTAAQVDALAPILQARPSEQQVRRINPRHFVQNWQMSDLAPLLDQAQRGRNLKRGRAAFVDTGCLNCHRFANEGSIVGPDLNGVGARYGPRDLLESIIEPSRVVSDQFAPTQVTTTDGRVVIGNVEADDDKTLVLRAHPLATETIAIAKADIADRRLSNVSLMPAGLVNVLTKDEILDLIAYLRHGAAR